MTRPLIGLTTVTHHRPRGGGSDLWQGLPEAYADAVIAAGGFPVLLPSHLPPEPALEILARLDGLVLSGGGDVDPIHFGEEPRPGLGSIDARRDESELALCLAALDRNLPVLGICRGIQLMNVALGGSVEQHLPDVEGRVLHSLVAVRPGPGHTIRIEPESILHAVVEGESVRVNSSHHQAVGRVAPELRVTARAEDGVIEAIEHPDRRFFVGVQWHPEREGAGSTSELFAVLIAAATAGKERK